MGYSGRGVLGSAPWSCGRAPSTAPGELCCLWMCCLGPVLALHGQPRAFPFKSGGCFYSWMVIFLPGRSSEGHERSQGWVRHGQGALGGGQGLLQPNPGDGVLIFADCSQVISAPFCALISSLSLPTMPVFARGAAYKTCGLETTSFSASPSFSSGIAPVPGGAATPSPCSASCWVWQLVGCTRVPWGRAGGGTGWHLPCRVCGSPVGTLEAPRHRGVHTDRETPGDHQVGILTAPGLNQALQLF